MIANEMFPWLTLLPVFAPADEGAGGGGGDTGGDAGGAGDQGDADGGADASDDSGTVLDGGAKPDQGGDGDKAPDEGDKSADGEGEDKEDGEADPDDVVPEEYDFSKAMPEGMELDAGMAQAMAPVFKDMGLTQAQANKMVAAYAEAVRAHTQAQADEIGNIMKSWVTKAKDDAEIGKAAWTESVRQANAVLQKFGTPELVQEVMIGQGVGNHPEVIRIFARIGKALSDDVLTTGKQTDTSGDVPAESRWYKSTPTTKKG